MAVIVLGFGPFFPTTGQALVTYTRVGSTTQYYTSYTPTTLYGQTIQSSTIYFTSVGTTQLAESAITSSVITGQSISTVESVPYSLGSYTLAKNTYYYIPAQIPATASVRVTFSASAGVDVYIFTSQQFAAYQSNGATANVASLTGVSNGTLGFTASLADTYTLVIYNYNNGILGFGGQSVGIYSVTSLSTYEQNVNVYSTQTGTQIYFVPQTTTATLSSVASSTVTTSTVSSAPVTTSIVSSSTVTLTNTTTTTTNRGLLGP